MILAIVIAMIRKNIGVFSISECSIDVNIKNKTLKALNSASGYIKNLLLKNLDLKSVPKLSFYLDESIEDKSRILDIIDNLPQASNKNDS